MSHTPADSTPALRVNCVSSIVASVTTLASARVTSVSQVSGAATRGQSCLSLPHMLRYSQLYNKIIHVFVPKVIATEIT